MLTAKLSSLKDRIKEDYKKQKEEVVESSTYKKLKGKQYGKKK